MSVTAHLATCPACEGEMDVTDVGPYTRVRCPNCETEVRVKTEVGDYRLVRRIAFGGMSVVYVAWDPTLDREIAVKVLSEEYSEDRKLEKQFQQEAELTAAVSHPNVVRVFTVGRAFDRFFIAMEFVSGQSLEERMAVHGALTEDEMIPLALQVVDGLRAAQGAGLVHRDIKPGNILIDDSETAKIVDFGLSLLTEGGSVRADEIWATPYYVPPEALEHSDEDFRSDIYSLGATLYHALAGQSPVGTKEMPTRELREAKRRVPPLKEVAPWLSVEMIRTVERAMAYERNKRFASYDEFRQSLELARADLRAKGVRYPVHGAVRAQRRQRQEAHRKVWTVAFLLVGLVAIAMTTVILLNLDDPVPAPAPSRGSSLGLLPGSDATGLDPEMALEINSAYERARVALAEDDFVVAERLFTLVWEHPAAPAQTAAWAGFESAVAAYLDGRPGDSRKHLAALNSFIEEHGEAESALGRRLRSAIEVLRALPFVPEDRVPQRLEDPFRATTFFAMALKMWEQAQFERASQMFLKLSQSGPWPEAEWMTTYQMLAARYVEDLKRMTRVDHDIEGKDLEEIEQAMEDVTEVYASLETRGRARFNVKVWQVELARRLRELRVASQ